MLRLSSVDLSVVTPTGPKVILDAVSFEIDRGEALGLVGESGSGKSMTARTITRLLPKGAQVSGTVEVDGVDVNQMSSRELRLFRATRVATVFQDARAAINPVRTIGDFLTEPLTELHGMRRRGAKARAIELLEMVRIDGGESRLKQYPHELSGGLLQRVMIAGALSGDPELIIADEPTTALDVTNQADVMATLLELRASRGVAMLFITHDLELAAATCSRTAVMYAGHVVEQQPSAFLHESPRHPYTIGLLKARPHLDNLGEELFQIPGRPAMARIAPGCSFAPRCFASTDICATATPPEVPLRDGIAVCRHLDRAAEMSHQSTSVNLKQEVEA